MTTLAGTLNRESDTDAMTDMQPEDLALDRAEIAARLARAANDEAQYLLQEAERLSHVLEAERIRRQRAWMTR